MKTLARTALLLVCALALVGCGLRLETSDPAAPSPGLAEQARARAVTDAVALADAASALATTADDTLSPVLDDLAAFSTAHVDALGGVYDSGLPSSSATTTSPPPEPTPAELLDQLVAATITAATDTDQVDDPDLARVLGSVTAARGQLTTRLAEALGVESPSTVPPSSGLDQSEGAPSDAAPSTPSSDATRSPSGDGAPSGPVAAGLALAHDQAGYAFEVIAAQAPTATVTTQSPDETVTTEASGSDLRSTARAAAEHHRAQATFWAQTGGFDGTATDPRRAQYQLPDNLDDPATAHALAVSLEQAVAQAASAALASAEPGTRADLLADLRTACAAATAWGADAEPLPGLPTTPATAPAPSPTP